MLLVRRSLTAHPLRSLLTTLAIALGVAMVLAAAIIGHAASERAARLAGEGSRRIDLEISALHGQPFPADVLSVVRASGEVALASPSLKLTARLSRPQSPAPGMTLIGVDPHTYQQLEPPDLADGEFLPSADSIALPAAYAIRHGLRTGDTLELVSDDLGRAATVRVGGRLRVEAGVPVVAEQVAYVPLPIAQRLAGTPNQIDRIEVRLNSGAEADRVRASLAARLGPDWVVARARVESGPAFNALVLQALLALVGAILLFAAGFVIANAFGMAVTARRKEFGALRTLGTTRRQVLRAVLLEAGVLGLAGAAAGLLAGLGLAWLTLWALRFEARLAVPGWALVVSPTLGLGATLASALLPAWQASRVSPMEAVRPASRVQPSARQARRTRMALSALVLLIIALGLFGFLGRPDTFTALAVLLPAMVILLALVALLTPALVGPVAQLVRPALMRWLGGTAGRLAADNLQRHPVRAALTAGAMTAGITMIIATSGLVTAVLKGGLLTFVTLVREDRVVVFDLTNPETFRPESSLQSFIEAAPLDLGLVAGLQALADSGRIELGRLDMTSVPSELSPNPGSPGVFVDPEVFIQRGGFDFAEGGPEAALRYFQQGPALLLMPVTAARLGVGVGDTVQVQTLKGPVDFAVAGIGGNFWVMTTLAYADGQTYFGVAEPTFMSVYVREGQDREAVLRQVDDLVATYPGLMSWNLRDGLGDFFRLADQITLLLNALLLMAVIVAALGVVNTMVINVAERRREIGMLRALGATQRHVRQMVMAEGAALGLFAVIAAVLVSLVIVIAYVLLVAPNGLQSLGFRLEAQTVRNSILPALSVMGVATMASLVLVPLLAALAAYYPARQAAAMDVIDATRSERLSLQPAAIRRAEGAPERELPRSISLLLAQRALEQHRTRTILSGLAVALGAAMTIAGDVVSGAIINALTQAEDVRAVAEGLFGQIDPILKGIGAVITLAAGFLVFNSFAMSVTQRRQQLGALRSLGMTRAQVMRAVLVEALIVGGSGVALGLVAGPLMGRGIVALLKTLDSPVLGAFRERGASALSFALALTLGLGVSLLAALVPARQAARLSPLVALKAPDVGGADRNPTRLAVFGLALQSLMAVYLLLWPPARWVQFPYDLALTVLFALAWIASLALVLPAAIGWAGSALAAPLTRLWGATGRLMADNLRRGRGRVLLTVTTLAIGLTFIVAMSGFFPFYFNELFGPALNAMRAAGGWTVSTFDITAGVGGYADLQSLRLPPDDANAIRRAAGERGVVAESYFVIVPELSYFYDDYFSFVLDPRFVRGAGSFYFTFSEGDWETALPILDSGCGLLVAPAVARNNSAGLGEAITVTGQHGPVRCTIAGIGQTFVGASIIGHAARDSFVSGDPFALYVAPAPGADPAQLEADLVVAAERRGLFVMPVEELYALQTQVFDTIPSMFSGFLLLAILAAALGVVNTTLLSITERRREFGQLRALGAVRSQVRAIVVGEAALMGLLGGALGLAAGAGLVTFMATVYGGNSMGVAGFEPWPAALRALPPTLRTGLVGLVLSPLVCAVAAYLPANAILRGAAVDTLRPEQTQPLTRQHIAGVLSRGSLQARFVLGTAALLLAVLAGLIAVASRHTSRYLEVQHREVVSALAAWNAASLELALPPDAQTLDLSALQSGQAFGADALLRFRSLMEDLSEGGLEDFAILDRANVVLFSLDQRAVGTTLPALESADRAVVRAASVEGDRTPRLAASAPVRNGQGELVGSVRLTLRLTDLREFLDRMRNTLWAVGGAIAVLGVLASWVLSAPFSGAVRAFGAQAARVGQGGYAPISAPRRRWPVPETSIRTRLTILMTLLVAALAGGMGLVTTPIVRDQLESTTKNSVLAAAEWMGEVISEGLSDQPATADQPLDLAQALRAAQNVDLGRLQEMTEQTRGETIAYLAIADAQGDILASDKLALVGERGPVVARAQITDGEWRDEAIWIASTPLRRGPEGEQVGTLSFGVRRAGIEAFLDETRTLFWLAGLIAVLAGVLLAQAVGGAVAAPLQAMVVGTQRVAGGELRVRFRADSRDELSQLGAAFNHMVAGLRERERLRDLFGKYVSREVSEAVLSGRVSLAGERRTITCLYVDMRGSTAFAERHRPEEVMAAFNQYFEVIILATEAHGGIVNRFVGDEAVCIFGAPTEHADHAERALNAALAMREGLRYVNEKRAHLGLPALSFGLGLNTGEVVAGATGSEERQEYTLIGDVMNVGARVQELNKAFPDCDILLTEFTHAALGPKAGQYTFADLGASEIRGKSRTLQIYALIGRR